MTEPKSLMQLAGLPLDPSRFENSALILIDAAFTAWVSDDARVSGKARVSDNAWVSEGSKV